MSTICFHCRKEIGITFRYAGVNADGEKTDIAFHPVCQGEFVKILIDSFIKDEKFREKREAMIAKGEWERD